MWMNPADIIYVCDNPGKDIQAPQQLGMKCVLFANNDGIYYNNQELKQHETIVVRSIAELSEEWSAYGR